MNGKENGLLIKADLDSDFFSMRNHGMKNRSISFKAKGLLGFMMQTPPGWQFSISGLSSCSTDGRTAISTGLKELSEMNYFKRLIFRKDGRFIETKYLVSDLPLPEDYVQRKFGEEYSIRLAKVGFVLTEIRKSDTSISDDSSQAQLNINELSIEFINYLFNKHNIKNENLKDLSEEQITAYQQEFEKEKSCAKKEKVEGLPPEEVKIVVAIEKVWSWLEQWPDMVRALKERAKITPEDEANGFNMNNEIENFVRRNSHNIQFMYDPTRHIAGGNPSLQSWLKNYHQFNQKKTYKHATSQNGKGENNDFASRVISGLLPDHK